MTEIDGLRAELRQIEKRIDARLEGQDEVLADIRAHVRATNGSIAAVKKDVQGIQLWRARLEGATSTVRWIPTFITAVAASGIGVLVALAVHP